MLLWAVILGSSFGRTLLPTLYISNALTIEGSASPDDAEIAYADARQLRSTSHFGSCYSRLRSVDNICEPSNPRILSTEKGFVIIKSSFSRTYLPKLAPRRPNELEQDMIRQTLL